MLKWTAIFTLVLLATTAYSESLFYSGPTGQPADFNQAMDQIVKGSIVIVSEAHGFAPHQANQEKVMRALQARGHLVDSGMEFIERRFQPELRQYLAGQLPESEFLERVQWGKIPFEIYKPLIWTPTEQGGSAYGINADRRLTGRVASCGLEKLNDEEKMQLPPDFKQGNAAYLERFSETMKAHVPPEKILRYFAAQSIWDDTMAFELLKRQQLEPTRTVVVVVGDFHNSYGGGLPDRLKARGANHIFSLSQVVWGLDQTEKQIREEVGPDAKYGARADWVFVEKDSGVQVIRVPILKTASECD